MKRIDTKRNDGAIVPRLKAIRAGELLKQLPRSWKINGKGHLERRYAFEDCAQPLAFVKNVGVVAEAQGHHPDVYLAWGKCKAEIWSHKS